MRISVSVCVCVRACTCTMRCRKTRKCYHIQTIIYPIHTGQMMTHTEGAEIKTITLDSDSIDWWLHYALLSSLLLSHACECFKQHCYLFESLVSSGGRGVGKDIILVCNREDFPFTSRKDLLDHVRLIVLKCGNPLQNGLALHNAWRRPENSAFQTSL